MTTLEAVTCRQVVAGTPAVAVDIILAVDTEEATEVVVVALVEAAELIKVGITIRHTCIINRAFRPHRRLPR